MAKHTPDGQGGNGTTNVHPQPSKKTLGTESGAKQHVPHPAHPPR